MSRHGSDPLTVTALRDLDAGISASLTEAERARADATFSRIVATPDDHPLRVTHDDHPLRVKPDRPRRSRRLLVAAGLVGATGAAIPALLLGGSALGSWTPTPTPLPANAATIAAATCRAALEVPDRSEHVLVAEQRGEWTYVLLGGPQVEAACLLPNDLVGQDPADLEGEFLGQYDSDAVAPPHVTPGHIVETMSMSGNVHGGLVNWVEGYVGRDVVGVTVHTPSGLQVEASVTRGRFAAWWPAGEATMDNPEIAEAPSFTVTLADGSTHPGARLDP
jgi:hypothetical protein